MLLLDTQLILIVGSISGLSSQLTARKGNILGILGVGSGIIASLAAVGFPPDVLIQFAGVAGIGSLLGKCSIDDYTSYFC